jgi:hypothetical protein
MLNGTAEELACVFCVRPADTASTAWANAVALSGCVRNTTYALPEVRHERQREA